MGAHKLPTTRPYSLASARPGVNEREEFLGHNIAHTLAGAATTWMLPVRLQIVCIVEGDFLACSNVSFGHHPDASLSQFGLAIGRAMMVDEPSQVTFHAAIQIALAVQSEDVLVISLTSFQGFALRDRVSHIFNDSRSCGDVAPGKQTLTVNRRVLRNHQVILRLNISARAHQRQEVTRDGG